MDDDLFTYEVEIPELSCIPCAVQQVEDLDDGDLVIYEQQVCFDENKSVYAEAVIFIKDSYKKQFEEYMKIKRQYEVYRLYINVLRDLYNTEFSEWLALKFCNHRTMDWYTKKALWIYWKRGDDEVVLIDEEISDLEDEKLINENEIAKIFKIKTDIFNFETPLCKAFNEFNYLLKVDMDLFTHDIPGFKTYEEFKNKWIHE
ncbi:hypothetical protein Tco_0999293 [Tanacetum coccineum]